MRGVLNKIQKLEERARTLNNSLHSKVTLGPNNELLITMPNGFNLNRGNMDVVINRSPRKEGSSQS